MTEQKLRALLENTLTEHSYRCLHNPEFTVTGGMEEEMSLLMTCPVSQVSGSCLTPRLSAWVHFLIATSPVILGVVLLLSPQTFLEVVLHLTTSNCKRAAYHSLPSLMNQGTFQQGSL